MFIILQIFFAMRAVLKIGVYSRISPSLSWGIFGHVTCSDQSRKDLMDYKGRYMLQFLFCFLKGSPVHGSIQRGDTVLSLYGCQVNDKQDWNSCISKTLQSPQHGYCTDMLTITRKNSSKGDLKSLCNQSLGRHSDSKCPPGLETSSSIWSQQCTTAIRPPLSSLLILHNIFLENVLPQSYIQRYAR